MESVAGESLRLSEPTQKDEFSETFGAPLIKLPKAVSLSDLLQTPDSYLDQSVTVKARVAKVCQKKGCFFIAQQGNESIRVAFKDYGFFVPTDIDGRQVTLVGQLIVRDVSPAQARHFSQDLGTNGSADGSVKNEIKSGRVFEIVASSVRVPLS